MSLPVTEGDFAAALLHAGRPVPPGITTARGQTDPLRFAVYRNNVFVGLVKALAARFPVTARLVGTDFFAGMARAFAQANRPGSPVIMEYGDDFPSFVDSFEPASSLAYLPDLARLEAAWTRAYHAVDAMPLGLAALAVDPLTLETLRLTPHPSATLIRSAHAIGSIWAAHQPDSLAWPEQWQPEAVLVVRPDMKVGVHVLPASDAPFAAALLEGMTLGEAAESAITEDARFDFGTALVGLVGLGAFAASTSDE